MRRRGSRWRNGAVARFADGSEIESDIVVGADGIHSAVRGSLFGPEAPRFTGCLCYRGLIPAADVPSSVNRKDMTLWMGPHGHIVHYPVKRGELLNVVAHYDSDAWTEESWTRKCEQSEVAATYSRWHESLQQLIKSNPNWYKWALYDREPLERWSVGRATLLGDSAHAMLPYLGQGAAMAIEDGCVLAACLSASGRSRHTRSRRTNSCESRGPGAPCLRRASAPRRTISPRLGRVSSATSGSLSAIASPGTRPSSRASGSMPMTSARRTESARRSLKDWLSRGGLREALRLGDHQIGRDVLDRVTHTGQHDQLGVRQRRGERP